MPHTIEQISHSNFSNLDISAKSEFAKAHTLGIKTVSQEEFLAMKYPMQESYLKKIRFQVFEFLSQDIQLTKLHTLANFDISSLLITLDSMLFEMEYQTQDKEILSYIIAKKIHVCNFLDLLERLEIVINEINANYHNQLSIKYLNSKYEKAYYSTLEFIERFNQITIPETKEASTLEITLQSESPNPQKSIISLIKSQIESLITKKRPQ